MCKPKTIRKLIYDVLKISGKINFEILQSKPVNHTWAHICLYTKQTRQLSGDKLHRTYTISTNEQLSTAEKKTQ